MQQVVDLLIVDLQIRNIQPSRLALSSGLREDLLQREEYEPFGLSIAQHRVSLARGGLAVHKNGRVTALQKLLNDPGAAASIHLGIALRILEHIITSKLINVIELYLALLPLRFFLRLRPHGMPGQRGDLLLLLIDAPSLHVLVLINEGSEPNGNFYLLAVLLHLTTN